MRLKLKKKWGIIPSDPIYYIGLHSINRFKKRVSKDYACNIQEQISERINKGVVLLERGNTRYVQSEDHIIFPCIKSGANKFIVKTTLPQELKVLFAIDRR